MQVDKSQMWNWRVAESRPGSPAICIDQQDRQTGGFASPSCDGFAKLENNLPAREQPSEMSQAADMDAKDFSH